MFANDPDWICRLIRDKVKSGWLAWEDGYDAFLSPQPDTNALLPWNPKYQEILDLLREYSLKAEFWENLSVHFSAENNAEIVVTDDISSVKSICRFSLEHSLHLLLSELFSPAPWR